jgi:hypothetical protein
MAKFKAGDKVRLSPKVAAVPAEWRNKEGIIQAVVGSRGSASAPLVVVLPKFDWEPLYGVLLQGHQQWVAVRESWLERV